jgi:hypothetical protein
MNIPALPPLASGINDDPAAGIAAGAPLQVEHLIAARRQHRNRKEFMSLTNIQATEEEVLLSQQRKHKVESVHFQGDGVPVWAQQMQQNLQDQMQQSLQGHMQQSQQNLEEKLQTLKQDLQAEMQTLKQDLQAEMQTLKQDLQAEMQTMQQDLQAEMQTMQQNQQQNLQAEMQLIQRKISVESERSMNRSRKRSADSIEQLVREDDGLYPRDQNVWFPTDEEALANATREAMNPLLNFYRLPTGGTLPDKRQRLKQFLQVIL